MSELEASMPSRADILSVIGGLEALRPAPSATAPAAAPSPPPGPLDAAQARHDQDAAALRDMIADRDAWRTAAERLQIELWRQMDLLRAEADQYRSQIAALGAEVEVLRGDRDGMGFELLKHRDQIAHVGAAITSLCELAESRATAAPAPAANTVGYDMPAGLETPPATQPPARPVDPDAPPMVIPSLAPDPMPQVKRKPIRAVQTVSRIEAGAAEATPVAAVEELPPVVEFTAPEPEGAHAEVLPNTHSEKKRRLRIG
jgi:hypothetical protein